jgi:hypothetical protein
LILREFRHSRGKGSSIIRSRGGSSDPFRWAHLILDPRGSQCSSLRRVRRPNGVSSARFASLCARVCW